MQDQTEATNRQYCIERVKPEFVEQIVEIGIESRLGRWTTKDYWDEVSRNDSIFLAATQPVRPMIVGFVIGRVIPGPSERVLGEAEIYNIGVRIGFRRVGIGRLLLGSFVSECRSRKTGTVWLEVRSRNHAGIKFYSKLGFQEHSIRKSFYRDPVGDALVLRLAL